MNTRQRQESHADALRVTSRPAAGRKSIPRLEEQASASSRRRSHSRVCSEYSPHIEPLTRQLGQGLEPSQPALRRGAGLARRATMLEIT